MLKAVFYLNGTQVYRAKVVDMVGEKQTAKITKVAEDNYTNNGKDITLVKLKGKYTLKVKIKEF